MKYDWSKLTPRERDALVAEHVMGWTNLHVLQTLDGRTYLWGRPTPNEGSTIVPHYTTDIAAAFTIVDKMAKDGLFDAMRYHTYGWDIFDMTPDAISLAALRAVGVDV